MKRKGSAKPAQVKTEPQTERKYKVETLAKASEMNGHSDILLAIFNSQDYITKSEARNALKRHLEREV